MTKTQINKLREILFLKYTDSWDNNILVFLRVEFDKFRFEDSQDCFESVRVISKNNLEGQQNHNIQEIQT